LGAKPEESAGIVLLVGRRGANLGLLNATASLTSLSVVGLDSASAISFLSKATLYEWHFLDREDVDFRRITKVRKTLNQKQVHH
jgi:hypothetical protein